MLSLWAQNPCLLVLLVYSCEFFSSSLRVVVDELESALGNLKVEKVARDELGLGLWDAFLSTDLRNTVNMLVRDDFLTRGTPQEIHVHEGR